MLAGGEYDVVKVLDFGLVKRLQDDDDPETSDSGSIRGTPHYLSPEGVNTPQEVDARSDLYALGAVGYCLLTGRPVFEGDTAFEVCAQHVQPLIYPWMNNGRRAPVISWKTSSYPMRSVLPSCMPVTPRWTRQRKACASRANSILTWSISWVPIAIGGCPCEVQQQCSAQHGHCD